jgi:hypothetical protein
MLVCRLRSVFLKRLRRKGGVRMVGIGVVVKLNSGAYQRGDPGIGRRSLKSIYALRK